MLGFKTALISGIPELAKGLESMSYWLNESQQGLEGSSCDQEELEFYHHTVLLEESVHFMGACEGKVLVDGTLGGGGHTERMLELGATVFGVDRDPEALEYTSRRLARYSETFIPLKGNFADIPSLLLDHKVEKVDGVLVDLGVSSRQFDAPERGFSFSKEGPLDMRMSDSGVTAADIVNGWEEEELARIFWQYGEERSSRKIARVICKERLARPFTTTSELAECIARVIPRHGKKIHPATKVFQALRIEVNDELGSLRRLLDASADILKPEGRLCVISFHSLEDRMVKRFLKHSSLEEIDRPEWPAPRPNPDYRFKTLTKKPVKAGEKEVKMNPRSRSAVLRVGERVNEKL